MKIGQDYTKAEAEKFAQQAYDKQDSDVSTQITQTDDTQDTLMEKRIPPCGAHPWLRDKDYDNDADEDNQGEPGY